MGTAVIKLATGDSERTVTRSDRSDSIDAAVARAVETLDAGGLVAFPTETVYGLAARADCPRAVKRLREVKSRRDDRPFTVHIGAPEDAADFVPEIRGLASRLIRRGWPGPLTLILPVGDRSSSAVTALLLGPAAAQIYFEGTVGIRCPDDPVAERMLRLAGGPVVASSANDAGAAAPRTGDEVLCGLDGQIDLLIDGGCTKYSKPSTIVRVTGSEYKVVREGVLDAGIIERMSKLRILIVCTGNTCRSPMAAGIARKMLASRLGCGVEELPDRGIEVVSAGTSGGGGCDASNHAVAVMARRGIELSGHASKALTAEMADQADVILTMTAAHRNRVVDLAPAARQRVLLLLGDRDLQDPIGGSEEEYEWCARAIEEGIAVRLEEVVL